MVELTLYVIDAAITVVAENGTPDELKACDGIYRHMVELQVEAANWKM